LDDIITKIIESKNTNKLSKSPDDSFKLPKITKSYENEQFKKMIVVDGFCLSKKDIFQLRRYFDKLSDRDNKLTIKSKNFIEEFFNAFSDKPHMKGVLPSLFNFLDAK
jgi:hypothetical protein